MTAAMAAAQEAPATESAPESHSFATIDEAVSALKDVRKEAAQYRTLYAPFRDAFGDLGEGSVSLVLKSVEGLRANTTEGVTQWLDLGKQMASVEEFAAWSGVSQEEPVTVEETTPPVADTPVVSEAAAPAITAADVAKAVSDALAADRVERQATDAEAGLAVQRDALVKEAGDLGFQPGTPQYRAFFDIAVEAKVPLAEAVGLYEAQFGPRPVAAAADSPGADAAEAIAAKVLPPVPQTGGVQSTGSVETPSTENMSARDKVSARIDAHILAGG
jgi:hypothetical protein